MISGLANSLASLTSTAKTTASDTKQSGSATPDPLTQKDTFLQLLVAQIRNQDPLKPTDGVGFLTQLAQFSGLEQSMQLKDEVTSVRQAIDTLTETVKKSQTSKTGAP